MIELLIDAFRTLLVIAGLASLVCWVRLLKRRTGGSIRNSIDSLLPAREQDRPYRTNLDGLILFSTGLLMMISTQVVLISTTQAMKDRGWIEMQEAASVEDEPKAEQQEPIAADDEEANITISSDLETDESQNTESTLEPTASNDVAAAETSSGADDALSTDSAIETKAGTRLRHASADSYFYWIVATVTAGLVSIVIVVGWLGIFFRKPFRISGLILKPSDIKLGFFAALLILPPVLLISALVANLIKYEHTVLNSLAEFPVTKVVLMTFLATAVLTPVVEELLVRGLIQGGLQRLADPPAASLSESSSWQPTAYWPLLITSGLFGLMHLGQGAAPIPLFFLSLGLGYLYRQTGSLTAPIIVHMVLNAMTLLNAFLLTQA
ncbi:MAG: CPBP family intramembrane glutamic endopeptidase [Planctomycetota bacterium]